MANKPITPKEMKAWVDATWEQCQAGAWQAPVQAVNNIRVRIMQEAYDLADRDDSEGYNSVKVMCSDVLAMINKLLDERQPEQEPIAWVYPEGLEALKNGKPWTAYGSNGDGRIPLYLNDAVAQRVESGAGFESLPASPKWQGLTDEEIVRRKKVKPILVRIMQEALDLADRNDSEGYNSVKVMCSEVLGMINKLLDERQWQGLTDAEREQFRQWAHPDIIEAIELKLQERNT